MTDPAALARLRELAQAEAKRIHFARIEWGFGDHHDTPLDCQHSDCLLVRADPPAETERVTVPPRQVMAYRPTGTPVKSEPRACNLSEPPAEVWRQKKTAPKEETSMSDVSEMGPTSSLESLLADALNRYSAENDSDTPDFILAQFLLGCLAAWNHSVKRREQWYGRNVKVLRSWNEGPSDPPPSPPEGSQP